MQRARRRDDTHTDDRASAACNANQSRCVHRARRLGLPPPAGAALTNDAVVFLCRLHNGDIADDAHTVAADHHRRLREFVRCTGVDLSEIPAWNANTTSWRAIARLASPVLRSQSRAG